VSGAVGTIDLSVDPERLRDAVGGIRVFAGYAGWGAGQLEDEMESGSWYVVDSTPDDVLTPDADGLWARVLRRQPGELAWLSTRPTDPDLN
jgi:putative transcriptional regulator